MSYNIEISAQELEAVEQMAAHGFQLDEVAEVLLVPVHVVEELYGDKTSNLYRHYRKGFLQSELELRARIFRDAKNGSSPAQAMAKKIMDDCAYKHNQR